MDDSRAVRTRAGLRRAGMGEVAIARAIRGGCLVRVAHDRYVEPGRVPAREALIATPGTATALGDASAARAWGLPASDPHLHVCVPHGSRRRGADMRGVVVHQRRDWQPVVVGGVAVTDPVTTVVDILRGRDLAEAIVVTDAALHAGLVDIGTLAERLGDGSPGSARARRALALCDGRAESPLESRLRLLLTLAGLPPAAVQHVVREGGRFVARVDLWYDGVVVEADGFEFHSERPAFLADLRKSQAYARLGLVLLRFSWDDVHARPERVVETVRVVLANVGARRAA